MMFDDEDFWPKTLPQRLYNDNKEAEQWWKYDVAKLVDSGPLSRSGANLPMRLGFHEAGKWDKIILSLNEVYSAVDNFQSELKTWAVDVFPTIEIDERETKSDDIQIAITSVLGLAYVILPTVEPYFKHNHYLCEQTNLKKYLVQFVEFLKKFAPIVSNLIDIFDSTGFIGSHCYLVDEPLPHPSQLLATPYYKYVLQTTSTNPAALFLAMRSGLFGLLSSILTTDMRYLIKNQGEATTIRPNQFENIIIIYDIIDHFVTLCTNVHYSDVKSIFASISQLAWITGFLRCRDIKVKEMKYPYDKFTTSLAQYFLWIGTYTLNSGYRSANTNHMVNQFKDFDVFNRQICLSKRSVELMIPVYEYLLTKVLDSEYDRRECNLLPPKELKPKLPDLIALPTISQLDDWTPSIRTNSSEINSNDQHFEYWEKKYKNAMEILSQEDGDIDTLIDIWVETPPVQSPLNLFRNEAKISIDFTKIYGRIQYVTGSNWDFRVKIIDSGSVDANVKILPKTSSFEPKDGEWKVVTFNPDHKIKIVKTGTYDVSVKLQ